MYVDGSSFVTPTVNPHFTESELSLLGLVISHAYLSRNILPLQISFPCLASMILPRPGNLPEEVMVEAFVDSLNLHNAAVVWQTLETIFLYS